MKRLRLLLLIGQIGRIWAKGYTEKRIFQSMAALGFFALFYKKGVSDNEANNQIDNL